MEKQNQEMVSIWTWSGLVLVLYGLILLGFGIWRATAGEPATTVLAELRADIWWPAAMLVVGGGLLWAGRRG